MPKLTKQGVRDLNYIKGRSQGVRLAEPPTENMVVTACRHRNTYPILECRYVKCLDCDRSFPAS